MERNGNEIDLELLHKIVYAEKRVTKTQLKNVDIEKTIRNADIERLTLKQATIIFLALAKVIEKRFKTLAEECNQIYQLLVADRMRKVHRLPSKKNITLDVENGRIVIKDDMIEMAEEEVITALETSIIESSIGQHLFDIDFEAPSIEQARESTMISMGYPLPDSSLGLAVKRRRVVEDARIEIAESIFRANIRNVADILMREGLGVEEILESRIEIDRRIEQVFERAQAERAAMQEERRATVEFEVAEPEVTFGEEPGVEITESQEKTLDLTVLPSVFVFDFIVQNYTAVEKSTAFASLLLQANQGKIRVEQKEPFSNIECTILTTVSS